MATSSRKFTPPYRAGNSEGRKVGFTVRFRLEFGFYLVNLNQLPLLIKIILIA
ncbi:hypothetical protein J2T14_003788 [Paenibacillus harenae]|nr:hypothetical protein [Paenibacillus harenae]